MNWLYRVPGIPDELFISGGVPMAKSEVRCLVLSKAQLGEESIIYDVGAGAGSYSIEAGLVARHGQVFAIEQNKEAVEVIGENISRFRTANVELVEGIAPGAMRDLPPAHSIIIGGGGEKLREILEESKRKLLPQGVVVVTAIFLETVGTALASLEDLGFRDIEVVQVAVSKAKVVGGKHMMTAQNPVYIIRGRK